MLYIFRTSHKICTSNTCSYSPNIGRRMKCVIILSVNNSEISNDEYPGGSNVAEL